MTKPNRSEETSFGRELAGEVGGELKREAGVWLKWFVGGALVGAVLFGGFGLYLFGIKGFLVGAAIGAAVGGVALWLFYLYANTI